MTSSTSRGTDGLFLEELLAGVSEARLRRTLDGLRQPGLVLTPGEQDALLQLRTVIRRHQAAMRQRTPQS